MDESFEVRVKRLFGSKLFESVPTSSFPASSWSVADGEVERREWNRERGDVSDRSNDPCSSEFADGGCFANKRRKRRRSKDGIESDMDDQDVDGDDQSAEEEEDDVKREGSDGDEEESELRSIVGLDPTLDNEDEEDEYDRAALCREGMDDDRLYMKDVNDHGPHLNYHSIFTDGEEEPYGAKPHCVYKDPRADHLAAGIRLEEDNKVVEIILPPNHSERPAATVFSMSIADDPKLLKPILKRKEPNDDSKPKKRVRFNEALKETQDSAMFIHPMLEKSPGIPDYMKNPSKYIHYTFENYEEDDLANRGAFEDFQNQLKSLNQDQVQESSISEPPKSVTFNPRRKLIDSMLVSNESQGVSGMMREIVESDLWSVRSTSIAAGESDEAAVCKMDEDDDLNTSICEEGTPSSRKGRKYRCRAASSKD